MAQANPAAALANPSTMPLGVMVPLPTGCAGGEERN